ncbi:hypothetical protein [Lactococcus garvieae]|uniref:Uncharacterized protein n=1 Tax=Lactococcus garvieae TaxID=1363 RepID=A0AA46TW34_9LACT|nr:hypothetical protein [Lactococcus garvieae]UYT10689.1 hypothetical protein OF801_01750 [Lactococcus garvieae]UYT12731.1 hypothetical protein OF800_01750 [Lactococcus garvieae]
MKSNKLVKTTGIIGIIFGVLSIILLLAYFTTAIGFLNIDLPVYFVMYTLLFIALIYTLLQISLIVLGIVTLKYYKETKLKTRTPDYFLISSGIIGLLFLLLIFSLPIFIQMFLALILFIANILSIISGFLYLSISKNNPNS